MSIASMAAALEEKKKQREREEELAMTGPQRGEPISGNGIHSFEALEKAAEQLDALLATMPGNPTVAQVSSVMHANNTMINAAVLNAAIPWWNDAHPSKQNMKRIQTSLKEERIKQGLTQRELAVKCDMSQGSITRAEKNGWISITTLLRIANALGKEIILN